MRCLPFALVTILVVLPAAESCADERQGAREYARLLERTSALLNQAAKAEQEKTGAALPLLERLEKDLPPALLVEIPRATIHADLTSIRRDLREVRALAGVERRQAIAQLSTRLETLARIASEESAGNSQTALRTARSTLREVLARREYRQTVQERLWERVQKWLREFLERLFSRIPERTFKLVSWVLAVVAGAALLLALVLVGRYFYLRVSGRPETPPTQKHRPPKRTRSSPEQLLETAQVHAGAGRYRDALRNVYTAALLLLDRARLLAYSESGTNSEYLQALRELPSHQPADIVQPMTTLFDEKIYGRQPVSAQDYTFEREQYQRLEGVI